jgi:hypothetical protein
MKIMKANLLLQLILPLAFVTLTAKGTPTDYFADNGFAKPVSTLQHPNAEYYNGVTYMAYQGPHEDPYVCAYNHKTEQWSGPFKAGTSQLGKTPDPTDRDMVDNHGRPALLVDGNGYIHLIFGGHGGLSSLGKNQLGTPGGGRQMHVVSKNPEDISSWEILDNITPFGTYSQFVKMEDGDIYLFYRHGSHRSDWVYQKSTDNCRTFSSEVSILKHKMGLNINTHDAWYAWFHEGIGDTIVVTFNYHPCKIVGHDSTRVNAYYMKMNCANESWENVEGKPLTMPVTKEYADKMTLACDTGEVGIRRVTMRVDATGLPHLLHRRANELVHFNWDGKAWQESVAFTKDYKVTDADFLVASPKKIRLLATARTGDRNEVSWWQTENGGQSWEKERTLMTNDTGSDYLMGSLARNAHPDAQVVVSEINPTQDNLYRKMFLLGKNGPVQRRWKTEFPIPLTPHLHTK